MTFSLLKKCNVFFFQLENIFFWSFSNAVVALKHFIISSFASTDKRTPPFLVCCSGRPWCFFIRKNRSLEKSGCWLGLSWQFACCLRQDYRLDGEVLLPYDLKASGAHATMLQKIGVLTTEEELDWDDSGTSWMLVAIWDFKVDDAYKKDMERVQLGCLVEIWPVRDLH